MGPDAIEQGLAQHGVPLFAPEAEGAGRPDPAELIDACLRSDEPRHRFAVVALVLALPGPEARLAVDALRSRLDAREMRWLRWCVLAADYLARAYAVDLDILIERRPAVPADLFARGALPSRDDEFGAAGLRTLADEVAQVEGPEIDWEASLADPVRTWLNLLWALRSSRLARARHARAN